MDLSGILRRKTPTALGVVQSPGFAGGTLGFNPENHALLFLLIIYYSPIRPHMGLNGKTPAEVMGIRVDGDDKWATLLAFVSAC